ncbi:DUF6044 family protein [Dyadobacter arcticus]|uniref:Uncharacterized protein n=1 Tax=Dyadobacter arcticus TaxID=1078754 RepID=A0ABX0UK04_9BACT|nr:DUF6044 family protein [Dyadobacter arcticus]NIJ52409.1 hypothetical protein [Dyadobacter arcticus]
MKAKYGQFHIAGVTLIFCLYHLPNLFLGQKAFFNAFDSLDSYVVWYRIVIQNGYAWAPPFSIVEPFMSGVPKFTLVSTYNFYYWLNLILPTFQAFESLILIISAVALAGMWLLCRKHLQLDRFSAAFLALSFAFTPFLPTWGLSIAGQPLLAFAIVNIRKNKAEWWNWLIIGLFPFTSNFQSAGVFMLFALGLLITYDLIQKKLVLRLLMVFAILLAVYSITKLDLLENILGGRGFVSHRMEMLRFPVSVSICIKVFARYFLLGNVDVALSLHTFILLPFTFSVFFFDLVKKKKLPPGLTATLITITLICLYIALLQWEPVVDLRNKSDLLRMYSLERFHIFLQILWHIAAAQAILLLPINFKKQIVQTLVVLQMGICFAYQPTYYEWFFKKWVRIEPYHYIFSFEDYYAEDLFKKIKTHINKPLPSYRVASIGIPPAVSQYNGLWTIDGYSSNYALPYKNAFRQIISGELEKAPANKGFFDYWGSQCVIVYDQKLGYFNTTMTKELTPPSRDIVLSHEALKELSCKYIISSETIERPEKSGLKKIADFESNIWRVTLYAVL